MSKDPDLSTPEKQKAFLDKLHADEDAMEERRYERDLAAADSDGALMSDADRSKLLDILLNALWNEVTPPPGRPSAAPSADSG